MLKIAILGLGDRGMNYGTLVLAGTDAQITAVCDKDPERVHLAAEKFHLTKEQTFLGSEAFFLAGKLADALFICTQDRDHYGHTIEALNLGYNVMVEKPVSPNPAHLIEIRDLAAKKPESGGLPRAPLLPLLSEDQPADQRRLHWKAGTHPPFGKHWLLALYPQLC